MKNDLRIVFMGTPDFAVPSLDILIKHQYNIVGIVTAPDKPAGRGQQLNQSAIKKYAIEKEIPVLQPEKLKNTEFIAELNKLNANLFIVVAFRMLPEMVWQMPQLGTFNLHASLLPQYRGAAPINWAVINGEKETGATTFFLQHEIDTGNIILQQKINIEDNDNAGTIHDKLMHTGAQLVLKTVQLIEENKATAKAQINEQQEDIILKHAPKIFKENCLINWRNNTNEIHNLIRGLSPYPTAFTYLNNKILKIYKTEIVNKYETINLPTISITNNTSTIELKTDNKALLFIKCNDGYLKIIELQIEGKKRMYIHDFLKGYNFS